MQLICYDCSIETSIDRLKGRKRGFPKRMEKLNTNDKIKCISNMKTMYSKIKKISHKYNIYIYERTIELESLRK